MWQVMRGLRTGAPLEYSARETLDRSGEIVGLLEFHEGLC